MPKYEVQLVLYRTVEAPNADAAADAADYEKSRIVDTGLAGDLGWTEVLTRVQRKKETAND